MWTALLALSLVAQNPPGASSEIRDGPRGSAPNAAGAAPLRPTQNLSKKGKAAAPTCPSRWSGPSHEHFRNKKSLAGSKPGGVEQTQILRAVIWPVLK